MTQSANLSNAAASIQSAMTVVQYQNGTKTVTTEIIKINHLRTMTSHTHSHKHTHTYINTKPIYNAPISPMQKLESET